MEEEGKPISKTINEENGVDQTEQSTKLSSQNIDQNMVKYVAPPRRGQFSRGPGYLAPRG